MFKNCIICEKCLDKIPDILLFYDNDGLKIMNECMCTEDPDVYTPSTYINNFNILKNKVNGFCSYTTGHESIEGLYFCETCKEVLCKECYLDHSKQYENLHKIISNDIYRVIKKEYEMIQTKDYKINKQFYEVTDIKKIKDFNKLMQDNNRKIYNDLITKINQMNNQSYKKYKINLKTSIEFNEKLNNDIINILELLYLNFKEFNELYNNITNNDSFNNKENLSSFISSDNSLYNNQSINNIANKTYNNYIRNSQINVSSIKEGSDIKTSLEEETSSLFMIDHKDTLIEQISKFTLYLHKNFIIKISPKFLHFTCIPAKGTHRASVDCLEVLRDGRVVSGSDDCTIKFWDKDTFDLIKSIQNSQGIFALHQLPNESLLSGTEEGYLKIWDVFNYQLLTVIHAHSDPIWGSLDITKNSFVTVSDDQTIKIWNTQTFEIIKKLEFNSANNKVLAEWVTINGTLITGNEDGRLTIWDNQNNSFPIYKELRDHLNAVNYIIELFDSRLVSASQDYNLKIWDQFTGECLATLKGHQKEVESLTQVKDGRIVSASWDKTIRLWDPDKFVCTEVIEGHANEIYVLEIMDDGTFVSGGNDFKVKFWKPSYTKSFNKNGTNEE